jgi:phosphoribosylaminoimidazolecarboxamide formyltransferase/IMP cyclohydrolase
VALKPLSSLPTTPLSIKRALISLSNKEGLEPLAKALHAYGVELLSTGGTAAALRAMNLPVKDVSELTGFPECLDGRVKTLHPHVHGGILARTSHQPDLEALNELNIQPIELVVVNLYPFAETVAKKDTTLATATEFIDIGGPTMIRAAAKNFAHVGILTHPNQYAEAIEELHALNGSLSFGFRQSLATQAFSHTAAYDTAIANYLMGLQKSDTPSHLHLEAQHTQALRYGENPHQKAAVYGQQDDFYQVLHGKQLSYNNLLDLDAAIRLISDFPAEEGSACGIFKHTVPCGVAYGSTPAEAYRKAFETDKVSPFGGIIVFNQALDLEAAQAVDEIFSELIIAPAFDEDALELLQQKKNRRLILLKSKALSGQKWDLRSVVGGFLLQERDSAQQSVQALECVTERKPTTDEMRDLQLAWKIVKHVKSNAIVYVKNGQTLGIGGGQTSRVDASKIAVQKALSEGLNLENCVVASDAFYPFADGVEAAAQAGAKAVIQPGGSVRDQEVIAAANKLGLAMLFTGMRHFRH